MQFSVYPFVAYCSCCIHLVVCSKSDIVHYGWFFQNLGKEGWRTFMHTTVCIACLLVPTTLSWEEELHTETETAARMFELLDVWCRGDCTLFQGSQI